MMEDIKLIVGLGNPGAEYDRTRHNAGFDYVDELARHLGTQFSPDKKYYGDVAKARLNQQDVWLLKPMTFMNRSGQSVAMLANFFKIVPEQILVAHDELDLLPGVARFKLGGGHGGHNGLRDIISRLGNNKNFKRLRIGIGHPGSAEQVVNFVLGKAPQSGQGLITQAIDEAVRQTERASDHWHKAMTQLNGFKAS